MVWTDAAMPCLSKAFQYGPQQKLFFHLNEANNYKNVKMKGGLSWTTKDYREWHQLAYCNKPAKASRVRGGDERLGWGMSA